ncbi:STAS domain-containing protein [Actinomadura sp. ATCC 31491]|uniref:Anti-sigma factor antagonist n=1 Tax=Actinomadura luzonensis TaxID=2805427 RepID=A0ABT0FTW6_9ACTN|nr:STAS domain-containing protein [Actinomadura luzonensis]MCK2215780.1 STAS domain-containing protein [Actinomadura luzonensis]
MAMTTDEFQQDQPGAAAAPDWLAVRVEERDGYAVIRLTGELDLLTRPRLVAACDALLERGIARIVVDAAGLRFCDCAGLSALLGRQREAWRRGGSLLVIGAHGVLARLLAITGAAGVLQSGPAGTSRHAGGPAA